MENLCKCGCKQKIIIKTKYRNSKYIRGHNSRIKCNFLKRNKIWNVGLTKENNESLKRMSEKNKIKISWNNGLTKETDRRVFKSSLKQKGKKPWSKGLTKDTDERLKILGIKSSKTRIEKKSQKGKKSHFWQGGISNLPYPFDFDKKLKEYIRDRDNHKCQLCGAPEIELDEKLTVHHIDYIKENLSEVNLISLCKSDNTMVNFNRKYWEDYFTKLMILKIKFNNP